MQEVSDYKRGIPISEETRLCERRCLKEPRKQQNFYYQKHLFIECKKNCSNSPKLSRSRVPRNIKVRINAFQYCQKYFLLPNQIFGATNYQDKSNNELSGFIIIDESKITAELKECYLDPINFSNSQIIINKPEDYINNQMHQN